MNWNEYGEKKPENLVVDRYSDGNGGYQREPRQTLVKKIVSNFDTRAFGVILVAKRKDGLEYVVDGGHRTEAAKILKIAAIPALVFNSDGPEHEAKVYVTLNTQRRALVAMDDYYASISEGNEQSIAICNFLKSINITVVNNGNSTRPGRLKFISLLRDRWNINANACRLALIFMIHTNEPLFGSLFSALWYLENKGISTRGYLEKYLSAGGLIQFKKTLMLLSDLRSNGSEAHKHYSECFIRMVNKRKSKNRIEI